MVSIQIPLQTAGAHPTGDLGESASPLQGVVPTEGKGADAPSTVAEAGCVTPHSPALQVCQECSFHPGREEENHGHLK